MAHAHSFGSKIGSFLGLKGAQFGSEIGPSDRKWSILADIGRRFGPLGDKNRGTGWHRDGWSRRDQGRRPPGLTTQYRPPAVAAGGGQKPRDRPFPLDRPLSGG